MNYLKIVIVALISVLTLTLPAQITVVTADKGPAANGDGLCYSLPATLFRVDVDLKKIEHIPGPLAGYTEKYLGTSDYLKESSVDYSVVDVDVHPVTIADEKASYYIVFSDKISKEDRPPVVSLTPFGTLRSVNMEIQTGELPVISKEENKTIILAGDEDDFKYKAGYNRKKVVDTVIRKITVDTMTINKFLFRTSWADKTEDEKAEEAARQIHSIRESRMNLLTGYHEVNFGESIVYMDKQLQKLEQQYLELFLGKERITAEHHTYFVYPAKEQMQKTLLETRSGDKLLFDVEIKGVNSIKPVSTALNNIIYYRIPADALVKITFNGKTLFSNLYPVSQLGTVTGISVYKAGVLFDPVTGVPVQLLKH